MRSGLKSIIIPNGVTVIKTDTFRNCSALSNVVFPESVTHIDYAAFFDCTSLTGNITLDNVIEIGISAFENTIIEEVRIGKHIKSIGKRAFHHDQSEIPFYVYINASNPPTFGEFILCGYDDAGYGARIVYVPIEALDAYREEWKVNIQGSRKIMGYDFENE